MAVSRIYGIGFNLCGALGLGTGARITELTQFPNKSITGVYTFMFNIIFADDQFEKIWGTGDNIYQQIVATTSSEIHIPVPINYFKQNKIIIKRICASINADTIYYISDKDELYGCGHQYQGAKPTFIDELNNVIDAKSCNAGYQWSIALCRTNNDNVSLILSHWCRVYQLPDALMHLLASFTTCTAVYSTANYPGSGHALDTKFHDTQKWHRIELFETKNINITKIAMSAGCTLFLDNTGNVWSCGTNFLGYNQNYGKHVYVPKKINHFTQNNIKIQDIQGGSYHCMALSMDGNIYSWGSNDHAQCGFDQDIAIIIEPIRIAFFDEYTVDEIKCGWRHSYAGTTDNKHYLFGDNEELECLDFDGGDYVSIPYQIDEIVKTKCKCNQIVDVELGCYTTFIFCC